MHVAHVEFERVLRAMKKGSSSLFSYFKPVSSQSPSTGNGASSAKTPPSGRKPGGQKKGKIYPSSASKRLEDHVNGASECIIAMETETKITGTPSGRKRPHPQDSEESEEEIGVRRVSPPHHKVKVQLCSYLTLFTLQTSSGRPKRVAAMTPSERQKAKRRAKRSLDSDESGTAGEDW